MTSTSPPVLTLWEPQRELLAAGGDATALLSSATRRAILSGPEQCRQDACAQVLVLAELASSDQSVCLIAAQRSVVREIRRALLPRVLGRWLAAGEAGQTEVPVHVVDVDERTGGLELAMAENLAHQGRDPVQEAHGYDRLRAAGAAGRT